MITGLAHVNLVVPQDTLAAAHAFYGDTLGLVSVPVPALQRGRLAWFNIADSGQQVHVAFGRPVDFDDHTAKSARHPCFRIAEPEALLALQRRIWKHFEGGGDGAPRECDVPGGQSSGRFAPVSPWPPACVVGRANAVADRLAYLYLDRLPGNRVSPEVLCERLCRQPPRVQLVICLVTTHLMVTLLVCIHAYYYCHTCTMSFRRRSPFL